MTNFRSAKVEVYDTKFKRVHLNEDAFDDDAIPRGFSPFNVQNIGGTIFVTHAKQDAARHDPVGGDGLGFVELFTPSGKHIGPCWLQIQSAGGASGAPPRQATRR